MKLQKSLDCFVWRERVDKQVSGKLNYPSMIVLGMVKIDSKYLRSSTRYLEEELDGM